MGWEANLASVVGAGAAMGFSAAQAAKNRKFQKKMYKHRYQYTVKDMRKAGLNPILAATSGIGGGGVPGGAMAATPSMPLGDTYTRSKEQEQKGGLIETQREQIAALIREADQRTKTSAATAKKIAEETKILGARGTVYEAGTQEVIKPLLEWLKENMGASSAKEDWSFEGARKRILKSGPHNRQYYDDSRRKK